jgi:hypothetical protein
MFEISKCSGNSEHSDDHFCQTAALPTLDALVVSLVLQARGDAGPLQAARRAARLVLLRLRARARLARAPAHLGRSEPTPAHAPGRAREGAEWTDDRGDVTVHTYRRLSHCIPKIQTVLGPMAV